MEDPFDYNYFKEGGDSLVGFFKTLLYKAAESSMSAATIQCGFMKEGRFNDGTGQVGRVQIDTQVENGWIRFIEPIKITK